MVENSKKPELRLSLISLLTRLTLGMIFFFAGLGKFLGGYQNFVNWMTGQFKDTMLPSFALLPFTYALPFVEIILGLLLLAGLFTRWSFFLTGLLVAAFIFGQLQLQHHEEVATHLLYFLSVALGIWASEYDRWSLDRLRNRKKE